MMSLYDILCYVYSYFPYAIARYIDCKLALEWLHLELLSTCEVIILAYRERRTNTKTGLSVCSLA